MTINTNDSHEKIVFIGCLNISFDSNDANSPASNQVQIEIIENIRDSFTKSKVIAAVNHPKRTWPYSKFFQRGEEIGEFKFVGFLNFLILKDITIYLKHLILILNFKPTIIFKYNVSFFESLFLFFVKKIFNIKVVIFLQDLYYQEKNSNWIKKKLESTGLKIASSFDVLVPITKDIISDYNLNVDKCVIFQGGLTSHSKTLLSSKVDFELVSNSNFFVFAGALEEYNGIKIIIDYWLSNKIAFELHIYGKGSMETYIKESIKNVGNIKFFGFKSESVVIQAELSSFGNICVRNSINLNQNYFFPSKFFNVLASPGRAFVNDFENLPDLIKDNCYILNDDLSNLNVIISSHDKGKDIENYEKRRIWLEKYAQWSFAIQEVRKIIYKG